jgi:hypothetical protein
LFDKSRDENEKWQRSENSLSGRVWEALITATILPFLRDQPVFDPEATQAMSQAFDQVCTTLKLTAGAAREREAIAVRIIELARRGERDSKRLSDRVLRDAGAA